MKQPIKKLKLHRETLRRLDEDQARAIEGQTWASRISRFLSRKIFSKQLKKHAVKHAVVVSRDVRLCMSR